jgi:hypothetical protein
MYALNSFQNGSQVNPDVGLDKFIRLDMLMVRERLQLACVMRIGGIVIAKKGSTAPPMTVSIKIFFSLNAFTLDKLLEFRNDTVPEFYCAREKGDITSFSIDGEQVRRNKGTR